MIHKKEKTQDIEGILKEYFPFLFILIFLLLHLCVSAYFPLTPDEAYYWIWSRSLQLGYPDHPPMVAYWIKAGTFFFGETSFGIRFFGVCSVSLATFFLWKAASNFFGKNTGKWIIYLFTCTLFSNVIALILTPDTPTILFLSTALWITSSLFNLQAQEKTKYLVLFLLLGFFLGLSFLSKYTAILAILGIYLAFALKEPSFFLRKESYFSFFVFLLTISPNIFWNLQNHGAAFRKQGHRLLLEEGIITPHYLELFGGQIGLVTPIIFFLILIVVQQKTEREGEKYFLLYTSLPALLFFLLYPIHARVQANWPFIIWPACLLIGVLAPRVWKISGCIVGGACVAIVYVQAVFHFLPLNAHYDPSLRQSGGWEEMAKNLEKKLPSGTILEAHDYALGAMLVYFLKDSNIKIGSTDEKIHFLEKSRIINANSRSIREIRGDFKKGQEEKICRYHQAGKRQNKIRCYALAKEKIKKISLFF